MIKCTYSKILNYLLISVFVVSVCGCPAFIIGSAVGALGGYAISKDTVQGETDKDLDSLRDATLKVLETMDASEIDDGLVSIIKAKIGKNKIVITIEELTPKTSRLKVKCRKNVLPNLALSQKLYVRIIEHAK